MHIYPKVPARVNLKLYVAPGLIVPLPKPLKLTVCGAAVVFFHVTVVPTGILSVLGLNAKLPLLSVMIITVTGVGGFGVGDGVGDGVGGTGVRVGLGVGLGLPGVGMGVCPVGTEVGPGCVGDGVVPVGMDVGEAAVGVFVVLAPTVMPLVGEAEVLAVLLVLPPQAVSTTMRVSIVIPPQAMRRDKHDKYVRFMDDAPLLARWER